MAVKRAAQKETNREIERFSCMDDCIHLKACRRCQKIAKSKMYGAKMPRYCTEECSAYETLEEIDNLISVSDAFRYAVGQYEEWGGGCDPFDVFTEYDMAPYVKSGIYRIVPGVNNDIDRD